MKPVHYADPTLAVNQRRPALEWAFSCGASIAREAWGTTSAPAYTLNLEEVTCPDCIAHMVESQRAVRLRFWLLDTDGNRVLEGERLVVGSVPHVLVLYGQTTRYQHEVYIHERADGETQVYRQAASTQMVRDA